MVSDEIFLYENDPDNVDGTGRCGLDGNVIGTCTHGTVVSMVDTDTIAGWLFKISDGISTLYFPAQTLRDASDLDPFYMHIFEHYRNGACCIGNNDQHE